MEKGPIAMQRSRSRQGRITSTPPIQGRRISGIFYRTICLLVIFEDGNQRTRHAQA